MSDPNMTLTGDDAVVHEVIRRYAPKFLAHGYEFKGFGIEGSTEIELYPVFYFVNNRTRMEIHLNFLSARDGLNGGLSAMIIKPVNRVLIVEDYLIGHGRNELTKFFTYRDPKTDVRLFAESFLDMLTDLLDTDLKPIIDGKTFEETPIDWQGYK